MGKWGQGLKIDLDGNKAADSTLYPRTKNFPQLSHPLQDKIR